MTFEEIIDRLDELEKYGGELRSDIQQALREAIAKLRDYQAPHSSDTSARLATIKDIPTERVIALAQAEAAGRASISASAAEGADAQPNELLTLDELRKMDGQPVWLYLRHIGNGCRLVDVQTEHVLLVDPKRSYLDADFALRSGCQIYRRPPEEV